MRTGRVRGNAVVRFTEGRTNRVISAIFVVSPAIVIPRVIVYLLSNRRHEARGRRGRTNRSRGVRRGDLPPRRRRGSGRSRSRSARRGRSSSRRSRGAFHQLEIEVLEKRTVGRHVPRLLGPMTNGTDPSTGNGTVPASLNGFDGERRHPFERILPFLALLVDGNSRSAGTSLARVLRRINELESVVILDIGNNRINRGRV